MGWSHRAEAGYVMEKITKACIRFTGSQNTYTRDNVKYFWEINPTTHKDGSITGTVYAFSTGRKIGAFKISGDGTKVTGPSHFVALAGLSTSAPKKKERFTLQKYTYHGFQKSTGAPGATIYVDLAHKHPDPLKKMIWGYDRHGDMVHGDFVGFFTKTGKSQTFEFEQTGKYAAEEKKVRHAAIIRAIKRGW